VETRASCRSRFVHCGPVVLRRCSSVSDRLRPDGRGGIRHAVHRSGFVPAGTGGTRAGTVSLTAGRVLEFTTSFLAAWVHDGSASVACGRRQFPVRVGGLRPATVSWRGGAPECAGRPGGPVRRCDRDTPTGVNGRCGHAAMDRQHRGSVPDEGTAPVGRWLNRVVPRRHDGRVDPPDQTCCGRDSWASAGPLLPSCTLCPASPSYWRRADNRADGRPYQPLTAEQVYE
jgi:hypothetical protein